MPAGLHDWAVLSEWTSALAFGNGSLLASPEKPEEMLTNAKHRLIQ